MEDVCSICCEAFDKHVCKLPGCEHTFHVHCMLNFAQYSIRCPLCRAVPKGVNERAEEEEILSPLQNTDVHSERTLTAQARITQRKLQHVRRMIDAKESNIQNRLEELMFDQWRNNPEIRMERRRLSILKAKATRLGNLLYTQTTI